MVRSCYVRLSVYVMVYQIMIFKIRLGDVMSVYDRIVEVRSCYFRFCQVRFSNVNLW